MSKSTKIKNRLIDRIKPDVGFIRIIGMKNFSYKNGFASGKLRIRKEHLNPNGVVHGGVIYSFIDTLMGIALASILKKDDTCTTIEIQITYLNALNKGTIYAEAEVINQGRQIAFIKGSAKDEKGKLISHATGSFYISRSKR